MLIKFEVIMQLSVICLLCLLSERLEQVLDSVRGECRLSKDTYDFEHRSANLEVVLDDGNEAVGDDSNVYLHAHSILDEESPEHVDAIVSDEVKIASVKHIARQRLVCEPVHRVNIMHLGIGNSVEYRYPGNDVNGYES